jgi:hypothetical protein
MQPDQDLKCLDETIASLGRSHDMAPCDLLLEHLRAARRYLLAATRDEYRFCLQQAVDSLFVVEDKTSRLETKAVLQRLLGSGPLKLDGPKQEGRTTTGTEVALANAVPLAPAL